MYTQSLRQSDAKQQQVETIFFMQKIHRKNERLCNATCTRVMALPPPSSLTVKEKEMEAAAEQELDRTELRGILKRPKSYEDAIHYLVEPQDLEKEEGGKR